MKKKNIIIYKLILLSTLLVCFGCITKKQNNRVDNKYYSEIKKVLKGKYFEKYEITKIDSSLLNNQGKQDVYQIYAKKKDTIIKIISFKNKKACKFCTKILVNGIYNFNLITLDPDIYVDGGKGDINIDGSAVSNSKGILTFFSYEKDTLYDVYRATNLKGLWYTEPDDADISTQR